MAINLGPRGEVPTLTTEEYSANSRYSSGDIRSNVRSYLESEGFEGVRGFYTEGGFHSQFQNGNDIVTVKAEDDKVNVQYTDEMVQENLSIPENINGLLEEH